MMGKPSVEGGGGGEAKERYHGNEVVLERQNEGSAVHAGEQGEREPQQHPLHLLLPHAGRLPMLQTQLRRAAHGHSMYLHHSSHVILPAPNSCCAWTCM